MTSKIIAICLFVLWIATLGIGGWMSVDMQDSAYECGYNDGSKDTRLAVEGEMRGLTRGERSYCDEEKRREYGRGFENGMKFKEYLSFNENRNFGISKHDLKPEYIEWSYRTKKWIYQWDAMGDAVLEIAEKWNKERKEGKKDGTSGPP